MKILIVSQHFWPEHFVINLIARELQSTGNDVTVFTGMPNYPDGKIFKGYPKFKIKKQMWNGINIFRVPIIPRGQGGNLRLALNYISFMVISSFFAPIICNGHYDAVLVFQTSPVMQALPAVILKKIRKIPLYVWVQDLWPESLVATKRVKSHFIQKILGRFSSFVYKSSDKLLIQSEAFKDSILQHHRHASICFLPNTCDAFYKPLSLDKPFHLLKGFIVIFTGNIGYGQSIETVVEAIKKLQSFHSIKWAFVGQGSKYQWLKEQIQSHKLENTAYLLGQFPAEDIPFLIAQADICLVSLNKSHILQLTVPSKVQTYLACGKPVVAATGGETARIIKRAGCGIGVPAEDAEKLSEAVLKLYHFGRAKLTQIGWAGRNYFIKNYEKSLIVNRLENILRRKI